MLGAPGVVLTPSFSAKEVCFARTNHSHAFFISVIIPKKGRCKVLVRSGGICYPRGILQGGKEGRRALSGSSCWYSAVMPLNSSSQSVQT